MKIRFLASFILFITFFPLFAQENKTLIYDKKGRLIQRNRVNFFGRIENDLSGIAIIKYEYDKKGNLIKKSYFNKDDQMIQPDTNSRVLEIPSFTLYKYDENNNLIVESNHYSNGALMDLGSKPAVRRMKYNAHGMVLEEYNYDRFGKLRGVGNLEKAVILNTYMGRRLVESRSYDKNKKILDFGLNIMKNTYDDHGRKIRTAYYFANSELYLTDLYFYDSHGNLIKEECYKKDKQLDYVVTYTYNKDRLITREYVYSKGNKQIEKHGIEINVPGWKPLHLPSLEEIKDVDGTCAFYCTVDKEGKIIDIRRSFGRDALIYAVIPYLKDIKLIRDESFTYNSNYNNFRGEIKIGILNKDKNVEEF
ncbi:MAG: hypothetical protein ACK40G_11575 [Cytophagaceae bacterium]